MADLNERLERLLSDQDSMQRVLEMAKTILAQRDSVGEEPVQEPLPEPEPAKPDLSALLSGLLSQTPPPTQAEDVPSSSAASNASPLGAAALAAILPQLMQAMSGQGDLVKQERAALVRAMRPYLKSNRGSSIERALRMANMTKAATNALHTLGR